MIPGAPSLTTSSGSPRPLARRSWKNARTVSTSSFEPAISAKRNGQAVDNSSIRRISAASLSLTSLRAR